jgi:large subunit ribosomal protein L25
MELTAQERTQLGKSVAALRREGVIPAELYGRSTPNVHLAIGKKDFTKVFGEGGTTTVITLAVNGQRYPVLVHDLQRDNLSGDITHVDFYQVERDRAIRAHVPLSFTGESGAVKQGGVLNKVMSEIEVEALPDKLPHQLEVDLSKLTDVGMSVHMKDIAVPSDVKVLVDAETVVVSVSAPRAQEEVPAAPETVDVTAVKVESEEKKAERVAKKTEEEKAA